MLKTIEDEDEVVRWAFAEIINYMKTKHSNYWFKKNFKHWHVHKILYKVFTETDIPVTMSWFRYGCFVHSTQLAGFQDFNALKNRYLASPNPERMRSKVAKIGVDIKPAISTIKEVIDELPPTMDIYLDSLYEDAPNNLSEVYISKLELYRKLSKPNRYPFSAYDKYHSWLQETRNQISVFQMAAFSREEFEDLNDLVIDYFSSLEEALLKIDAISGRQDKVMKKWSNWIFESGNFFDCYIWFPFAIEISAETVTGLRRVEEKAKRLRKKPYQIVESKGKVNEYKKAIHDDNLDLPYSTYFAKTHSTTNKRIIDSVSEIERIYEKNPQ
ncbi:MAG: hypothetical protein NWE93_10105 [Candidatus Bathyarchaeota archaeon]|nr:hypothetical protein [Candidatus Bathyarchaeota archaeon]